MSSLHVASIGSYPRTGEDKDQQRYPRALGHFERKEISAHALRDVEQSVTQEIIREQLDAGVDEPTDGLLTWIDPVSRFTRHLSNVKSRGLGRYFDNNFYFRIPTIVGKPRIGAAVSAAEYIFARDVSNKPVRAVLTGPITLAVLSRSSAKPYDRLQNRVDFFSDVIAQEAAALASEKAPVIQIDEPALVFFPERAGLLGPAVKKIAAVKGSSRLALALYFGSVASVLPPLKEMPFDIWQLDLVSQPHGMADRLAEVPEHITLGLGIVDGRNTAMEPANSTAAQIAPWLLKRPRSDHYLSPSCGLEFLSRPAAAAKLRRLAEIRQLLSGMTVGGIRG